MKLNKLIKTLLVAIGMLVASSVYANSIGYRDLDGNLANGVEAYFDGNITYAAIFKTSVYLGTFPGTGPGNYDSYILDSHPNASLNLTGKNYDGKMRWDDAMNWAANLNINGITDWKLGGRWGGSFIESHFEDGFIWWQDDSGLFNNCGNPPCAYVGGIGDNWSGGTPTLPISDLVNAYAYHVGDVGIPTTIPLPAALPLMLSGLGVLGFASRRRKNTAV